MSSPHPSNPAPSWRMAAVNRALALTSFVTVVVSGWLLLAVAAAVPFPTPNVPTAAQAVVPRGGVWAWGTNASGQLGRGDLEPALTAGRVPELDEVVALAAGSSHSLGLRADGSLWSWGGNSYGQLGDGTRVAQTSPKALPNLPRMTAVAAGDYHTVALDADGAVWAWGLNGQGQTTGAPTLDLASPPARVPRVPRAAAVAAGMNFSLALARDGTVWTWGANSHGTLGQGDVGGASVAPAPVAGLPRIVAIGAGGEHALAIDEAGALWAWGANGGGQLGVASREDRAVPARVAGLPPLVAATGGLYFTAARDMDGAVWIWGTHGATLVADGARAWEPRLAPAAVALPRPVTALAAGLYDCYALLDDGSIWAWGVPFPYGAAASVSHLPMTPTQMSAVSHVGAIAAGGGHALAAEAAPGLSLRI